MKAGLILLLILLPLQNTFSQVPDFPIDNETGEILYTGIVEVPSSNKEQLFLKANEWFANFFKSSKDVIQLADKETGKFIGKGVSGVYLKVMGITDDAGYVSFTVDIDIKDEKYRYAIRDLRHHDGASEISSPGDLRIEKSGFFLSKKVWIQIKEQTDDFVKQMIKNLELSMSGQDDKNDDW